MTDYSIDYFDVARSQIETAIMLYNDGNWISSYTLAAAATGVLKKFIKLDGNKTSFTTIRHNIAVKYDADINDVGDLLNSVRNSLNHAQLDNFSLCIDTVRLILMRAITDYNTATGEASKAMKIFVENDKRLHL